MMTKAIQDSRISQGKMFMVKLGCDIRDGEYLARYLENVEDIYGTFNAHLTHLHFFGPSYPLPRAPGPSPCGAHLPLWSWENAIMH